ncbi:MAG: LamG domain-containing protein, partial [Candidatus Thermoplasmatota archaeon]
MTKLKAIIIVAMFLIAPVLSISSICMESYENSSRGRGTYGSSWTQTTQADFDSGAKVNVETSTSPGDVKLSKTTVVRDGSLTAGTDLKYQYSPLTNGYIKANWDAITGAQSYKIAIGTYPGGNDTFATKDVGTVTSYTATGLTLAGAWTGTTYYVSITPVFSGGDGGTYISNGIQIPEAQNWDGISTTNPVALYHFDETSGTTASDASGNGNNGALTNGPIWTSGKFGGALQFDGVDDWVRVPKTFYQYGKEITVEAWVYFNAWQYILSQAKYNVDNMATNVWLWHQINGGLTWYVNDGGTWRAVSVTTLSTAQWYHIVTTANANSIKIYINGVETASGPGITTGIKNVIDSEIGTNDIRYATSRPPHAGLIDEVAIWDTALTADQIKMHYSSSIPIQPLI